jgi:hypothetical protein
MALLGAAMIVPLFIPARWRAAPGAEDEDGDEDSAVTGLLSAPSAPRAEQADLSGPR